MRAALAAATATALLLSARPARAIERLFVAAGAPAPTVDDAHEILFVARYGVEIGETCGGGGGDAGVPAPDAGAGAPDAGCEPVLGDAISMFVQPRFSTGPDGARFALLVVTPAPAAVQAEPRDTFTELDRLTQPEVVIETVTVEDPALGSQCASGCGDPQPANQSGCGGGYDPDWMPPDDPDPDRPDAGPGPQMIGAYEVARIPAADVAEIAAWLEASGYLYTQADLDAVAPYVAAGWAVTALRVAVDGADDGALEPLSFTWPGSQMQLPLGLLPSPLEAYPLTVYTYAIERRDFPIGEVEYAYRVAFVGDGFLTRTELRVGASTGPAADPIATAVPGDPTVRETITVIKEVHVPVQQVCDSDDDSGGCCRLGGRRGWGREANFLLIGVATLFAIRRRRR